MKYFKNGLICSKINTSFYSLINKLAKSITKFYQTHNLKKIILIGNDSRSSADQVLSLIASTFLKFGIEVHNIGECNLGCISFIAKKYDYPLSLYITAEDLTHEFCGIQILNRYGKIIDKTLENIFEYLISKKFLLKKSHFAKLKNKENLKQDYIFFLKNLKKFNFLCVFDCSNGGIFNILKNFLPKCFKLNSCPNGENINFNCGINNIEMLKTKCIKNQQIGFSFNASANKILIVDKTGYCLSSEEIVLILSKFFQHKNDCLMFENLSNDKQKILRLRNIKYINSQFSNENELLTPDLIGTQDYQFMLSKFSTVPDGLIIAILFANILETSKLSIKELLKL